MIMCTQAPLVSHSKASFVLFITTDEMLSLIKTSLLSSSLAEESHGSSRSPCKEGHELESTYSIDCH